MAKRKMTLFIAVLGSLAALAPAASAQAQGAAPTPDQAYELGKEAFTYGFPLLEFNRVRSDDLAKMAPVNRLANAQKLAEAGADQVVAPNVDTLYSLGQFDLEKPLVLQVPKMKNRYWVFEFVEPWTNVVGYVGQRLNGGNGGTWALEWEGAPAGKLPRGVKRFRSPARRLWVIGRVLVKGRDDTAAARRLMSKFRTGPLAAYKAGKPLARPLSNIPQRQKGGPPAGLEFIRQLNAQMATDPPPEQEDRAILERLAPAGVGIGRSPDSLPADVQARLADGVNAAYAALPVEARLPILQQAIAAGGWYTPPADIGAFGTNYTFRARVALVGLGANTPVESVYPVALATPSGETFNGANRYRMVFEKGKLPPTKAFWSLTMYDTDGYLVANPSNIYAIGDSHPPLRRKKDGSVVVVIQKDKPTEKDVNWLPAPADKGFRLNLRLYMPKKAILDGSWKPPGVEKAG
ncbi:MAG: DUF1254 domain-containing protein [Solirubrobacterales bacterium]